MNNEKRLGAGNIETGRAEMSFAPVKISEV